MPKTASYGTWPSPITSSLTAEAGVGLGSPWLDSGHLYWLELRPTEAGRYVLVRRDDKGQVRDVTPPGMSVRTRVHEYGGGAFAVHRGVVYFCNDADQRLYRHEPDSDAPPRAITPEPDTAHGLRYADMHVSPDGAWLLCVRERHVASGQPHNEIVLLPASSSEPAIEPMVVASGHDFFAAPRLDASGRELAWLAWDHPRMPWDGTELYLADFDPLAGARNVKKIAGGADESVVQPVWSPDGVLHYVSDRTGWWNLYAHGQGRPLMAMDAELGLPMWIFGQARYAFLAGGRMAVVHAREGVDHLAVRAAGADTLVDIDTPYSSLGYCLACDGEDTLAVTGGAFDRAGEIAILALEGGEARCTVIKRSMDLEPGYLAGYLSRPRSIEFPTADGEVAHALFYPPANKDCTAPAGEKPPLVVRSHGGPTASASSILTLSIQFWTSRGFAVVDVDYRGSAGYGRAYRQRLSGHWGIVDAQDCVDAARYLADQGEVDGARMVIRGGSAGGYTTLCALAFHDVFAAGASYYGVADLEALAQDTHKFESRYLDSLIGPYPERKDDYVARSPIHHTDKLSSPIILLQGLEDRVVPPQQAEAMAAALEQKGLPWAYVAFAGEQHGFRKAASLRSAIEAELYFYSRVLGFTPADQLEPVDIKNLS
jgi:dipeptidyl aminopeptidase/acylaminoacyl peptidase